jgi:hypothetical protein
MWVAKLEVVSGERPEVALGQKPEVAPGKRPEVAPGKIPSPEDKNRSNMYACWSSGVNS